MLKKSRASTTRPARSAAELRNLLGIEALEGVSSAEPLRRGEHRPRRSVSASVKTVFSEPQLDDTFGTPALTEGETCVRAWSISPGSSISARIPPRSAFRSSRSATARIDPHGDAYIVLSGRPRRTGIGEDQKIRRQPGGERAIASMELPETLRAPYALPSGRGYCSSGFLAAGRADGLKRFVRSYGLAMDDGRYRVLPVLFPAGGPRSDDHGDPHDRTPIGPITAATPPF